MLKYDPKKRISAETALKHRFFIEEPQCCERAQLQGFQDFNVEDRAKRKKILERQKKLREMKKRFELEEKLKRELEERKLMEEVKKSKALINRKKII